MSKTSFCPRVSGIMAARNAADFIGEAIESALGQTFTDFELLVVDDGSTDETAEIAVGYARRDERVRFFRQPECRGQGEARNLALREARGPWIAVLDADDRWRPHRLERQLTVVNENPSVRLVTSKYQNMDSRGSPLEIIQCARPEWWLRWKLFLGNVVGGHSQVLFHRESALACGGYRSPRGTGEDYRLWVNLAACGGIGCVFEVLMDYRLHEKSISKVRRQEQRNEAQRISDQALSTLLGENWPPERLALLRDFWSGSFPEGEFSLSQLARDQRQLEEAFWQKHSLTATLGNRLELSIRRRRQWLRFGMHLRKIGRLQKSIFAGCHGFYR